MSKLPVKTTREGDKITKVCVEDVYKLVNRIIDSMDKAYNKSIDILDSITKEVDGYEGSLIVGTGVSQPCGDDVFDEQIGNDIAFIKAKLNANWKKVRFIDRIVSEYRKLFNTLFQEFEKLSTYIEKDIDKIKEYNPNYLDL
jgi:hypothetical protein